MVLRVLLLDQQTVYRWGLKAHLSRLEDCEVRGTSSVDEAIGLAATLQPQVAVIDAYVPDLWQTVSTLLNVSPATRLLALATTPTPNFVVQALQAGVCSIMLKNDPPHALIEAVSETAAGRSRLSPALTPFVVEGIHQLGRSTFAVLSRREREVATLLLAGKTNDEIAASLVISKRTVETHLLHIYRKLGVHDRAGAILLAAREGWIHPWSVPAAGAC